MKTNNSIKENLELTSTSKKVIGKWAHINPDLNDISYEFFPDSIWKLKVQMDDGTINITKGKYYVMPDSTVFLRCFGSQHWLSIGDTINDRRTSLGAHVLFLEGTRLIDNQEDYEDVFVKK